MTFRNLLKTSTCIILMLVVTLLTACSKDSSPGDETSGKYTLLTFDRLVEDSYTALKIWSDPMVRSGEYAGDNVMSPTISTDSYYEFFSFARTSANDRLKNFWKQAYEIIIRTSAVITKFDEGQSEERDNQIGECYYIRGMMYFYLCRAYGYPYYRNPETNLGIPVIKTVPDNFGKLSLPERSTVKVCYEQIIADLKKGEELMYIDKGPTFASKEAAQALLSRVYLYMSGTYENPNGTYAQLAVDYADKVINSGVYNLLSRDNFMKYNTFIPENNEESIFAVKREAFDFSGADHPYGMEGLYSNIGSMGEDEIYASAKFIDLLNETGRNDWRPSKNKIVDARAAFIKPVYKTGNEEVFRFIRQDNSITLNYVQAPITRSGNTITCREGVDDYTLNPIDEVQELYSINYKNGETYIGIIDYCININSTYPQFYITKCSREGQETHLHSPVISRLGEIYLNRAEGYAKLGKYDKALLDLNIVRERALGEGSGYATLNQVNASVFIDKERQLELAYQGERSYDIFRNDQPLVRRYPGSQSQIENILANDDRIIYSIPNNANVFDLVTLIANPGN